MLMFFFIYLFFLFLNSIVNSAFFCRSLCKKIQNFFMYRSAASCWVWLVTGCPSAVPLLLWSAWLIWRSNSGSVVSVGWS